MKSLPVDEIEIDIIKENSISTDEAKIKVEKAINNISSKQGLDLNSAFEKVANIK